MSIEKNPIAELNIAVKALRETAEQNSAKRDVLLDEKMANINASIDSVNEKVDALALAAARPAQTATKADDNVKEIFVKGLRKGFDKLSETETKAMSVGDSANADGGYTVPRVIEQSIIAKVFESNPMRALAGGYTTGGNKLEFFVEGSEVGAGWIGETADRVETGTAQISNVIVELFEMYAEPRLTRQVLEDSFFSLDSWIASKVGEKFGRMEATAFVSGDGSGKPKGILAYAGTSSTSAIVKRITTATAGAVAGDDLYTLIYDLKAPYLNGACWQMGRATQSQVRTLKDGQGRYLWEPSLVAGSPSQLVGFPVYQNEDLQAFAAGNDVAIFGNMKSAYAIVDHPGSMIMIRDELTAKAYVKFYTRTRVGGGLVQGEAARILKLHA